MTKKELIEKLKDLPDDTIIYIPERDSDVLVPARSLRVNCDGSDGCQAEVSFD